MAVRDSFGNRVRTRPPLSPRRPSRAGWRAAALRGAVLETLEPRLLFTTSISGMLSALFGSSYALSLNTTTPAAIDHWVVNWGDGSDPDNDGVVGETIPGTPSTPITHEYLAGLGDEHISAATYDSAGAATAVPNTLTVAVGGVTSPISTLFGTGAAADELGNDLYWGLIPHTGGFVTLSVESGVKVPARDSTTYVVTSLAGVEDANGLLSDPGVGTVYGRLAQAEWFGPMGPGLGTAPVGTVLQSPKGVYQWTTLFDLSDYYAVTASINLNIGGLHGTSLTGIYLNGQSVTPSLISTIPSGSNFVAGVNTLTIETADATAPITFGFGTLDPRYWGLPANFGGPASVNVFVLGSAVKRSDVTTSRVAPTVSLVTTPATRSFPVGQDATLTATAAAAGSGNTIAVVKFYDNGTFVGDGTRTAGTAGSGTWTTTWHPTAIGIHRITVNATDRYGFQGAGGDRLGAYGFVSTPSTTLQYNPGPVAAATPPAIWGRGDIFTTNADWLGHEHLKEYSSTGVVRELPFASFYLKPDSFGFDEQGNFYYVADEGGGVHVIGPDGISKGVLGSNVAAPRNMLFDDVGHIYLLDGQFTNVAAGDLPPGSPPLARFSLDGNQIDAFPFTTSNLTVGGNVLISAGGSDLARDQHSLWTVSRARDAVDASVICVYLDEVDLNTGLRVKHLLIPNAIGSVVAVGSNEEWGDVAILPDGSLLVANLDLTDGNYVALRMDQDGNILQRYGENFAAISFVLAEDGTSFWSRIQNFDPDDGLDHQRFVRFDIRTGDVLQSIPLGDVSDSFGTALFGGARDAIARPNAPYTYQATAEGFAEGGVSYQLVRDAHGATISPTTGLMSWTPAAAGSYEFSILAYDSLGHRTYQTFTVVVSPPTAPNTAPEITTNTVTDTLSDGRLGRLYVNKIEATDGNHDPLTFSLVPNSDNTPVPQGMTIDAKKGTLQWTPVASQLDANHDAKVTVMVSDGQTSVQNQYTIHILIDPFTATPDLFPTAKIELAPDTVDPTKVHLSATTLGYTGSASLNYAWESAVTGAGAGVITQTTGTPSQATLTFSKAGTYWVAVTISDGAFSTRKLVSVTMAPIATSLAISGKGSLRAGSSSPYTVSVLDQFGDPMANTLATTWSVVEAAGGSVQPNLGLYTAPATLAGGSATYHLQAVVGSLSQTKAVTVQNSAGTGGGAANLAPFITLLDGQTDTAKTVTLFAEVEDDGPASELRYTWSAAGPSGGAVFDATNGTNAARQIKVTFQQAGHYVFTVHVTDLNGAGASDELSGFTVDVPLQLAAVAVAPAGAPGPGGVQAFVATGKDQLGNAWTLPLDFVWSIDDAAHGTLTPTTGDSSHASFTPGTSAGGTITVTASGSSADGRWIVSQAYSLTPGGTGSAAAVISAPDELGQVKTLAAVRGTLDPGSAGAFSYRVEYAPAAAAGDAGAWQPLATVLNHTGAITAGDLGATFDPTVLPNGQYTLRVTMYAGATLAGAVLATATRTVSVTGDLKVGNLAFSETDLTVPMGAGAFSIGRSYDSNARRLTGDVGYGWASNLDLRIQEGAETRHAYPFSEMDQMFTGSGAGSLSVRTGGDRSVFVTLPTGRRVKFTFALVKDGDPTQFRATFTSDDPTATLTLLGETRVVAGGTSPAMTPFWHDNDHTSILGSNDWRFNLLDAYEIPGYVLTQDGVQYVFEKTELAATAGEGPRYVNTGTAAEPADTRVKKSYANDLHLTKIIDGAGNTVALSPFSAGGVTGTLLKITADSTAAGNTQYLLLRRAGAGDSHITGIDDNVVLDAGGVITSSHPAVQYAYDAAGNLQYVRRSPTGSPATWLTTEYGYNAGTSAPLLAHALEQVKAPGIATPALTVAYSPVTGRMVSTTDLYGHVTAYAADAVASRQETITDARGMNMLYEYDDDGNVYRMTNLSATIPGTSLHEVTYAVYEPGTHNKLAETVHAGTALEFTRYYTYDGAGAQTGTRYAVGGYTIVTSATYTDIAGQHLLATSTDAFGTKTVNTYDQSTGNLLRTDVNDPAGQRLQKTTFDNYDAAGNLLSVTQWNKDATGWYRATKTWNTFDGFGHLLATRTFGFASRQYESGTFNDAADPATLTTLTLLQKSTMTYDDGGRVTSSTQWNTSAPPALPAAAVGSDADVSAVPTETYNGVTWYAYARTATAYDAAGRVARTTDALGRKNYTFYRDADGKTDTTVSYLGVATHYTYDSLGRPQDVVTGPISMTDLAGGNLATILLDAQSLDPAASGSLATKTTTTYVASGANAGKVYQTIDAFGHTTTQTYDAAGRLVRTDAPDGTNVQTRYDALGRVVQTIYSVDNTSSETLYDVAGQVTYTTDRHPLNQTTNGSHTLYNLAGQVVGTERVAGLRVDLTLSSATGVDPAVYTAALAVAGTLYSKTATHYDVFGRVDYTIDTPHGFGDQRTDYLYDALGRQTSVAQPARPVFNPSTGANATVTPTTLYVYDALGRQMQVTAPANWSLDAALAWHLTAPVTAYEYNDLGQVIKTTFADGSYIKTAYDALGRKESMTAQLAAGSTTAAELARTTTYAYDQAGNLTDVYLPAVQLPGASAGTLASPHYHYGFNALGQQVTQTDANGHTTTLTYDAFGRQNGRTFPAAHDLAGTLMATLAEASVYDRFGRLYTSTSFEGRTTTYTYDDTGAGGGRLDHKVITDAAGGTLPADTFTYYYNTLGQLDHVTESVPGVAATLTYLYDPQGNVKQTTSSVGVIHDEYDPMTGQLMRKWTGADSAHITTDLVYAYDAFGRLSTVSLLRRNGTSVALPVPETTTYRYDAAGNLQGVQQANGTLAIYAYDALNRLVTLTQGVDAPQGSTPRNGFIDADETILVRFAYTLNADGTKAAEADVFGTPSPIGPTVAPVITYAWGYDADGRLMTETYANTATPTSNYTDTYSFDLTGNRLTKNHASTPGAYKTDYSYDEADRLLLEFKARGSLALAKTAYGYTLNGQASTRVTHTDGELMMLNDDYELELLPATSTNYAYDLQGRLVSQAQTDLVAGTTATYSYAYDAAGNRIGQTSPGNINATIAATYLIDSANPTGYSQILETYSGGLLSMSYVLGLDVVSQATGPIHADTNGDSVVNVTDLGVLATNYGQSVTGGAAAGDFNGDGVVNVTDLGILATDYGKVLTVWTFIYDGHGSTRAITNPDGTINQNFAYDAYGIMLAGGLGGTNALVSLAESKTSLLYSGEQTDKNGMQYLRARYYNPAQGRFLSFDSYRGSNADPASLHKYLYANANPINGTDPTGWMSVLENQMVQTIRATLDKIYTVQKVYRVKSQVTSVIDFIEAVKDISVMLMTGGLAGLGAGVMNLASKVENTITNALGRELLEAPMELFESVSRNAPKIAFTNSSNLKKLARIAKAFSAEDSAFVLFLPSFGIGTTPPRSTGLKVRTRPLLIATQGGGAIIGFGFQGNGDLVQLFHADLIITGSRAPHVGPTRNDIDTWVDGKLNYQVPID